MEGTLKWAGEEGRAAILLAREPMVHMWVPFTILAGLSVFRSPAKSLLWV